LSGRPAEGRGGQWCGETARSSHCHTHKAATSGGGCDRFKHFSQQPPRRAGAVIAKLGVGREAAFGSRTGVDQLPAVGRRVRVDRRRQVEGLSFVRKVVDCGGQGETPERGRSSARCSPSSPAATHSSSSGRPGSGRLGAPRQWKGGGSARRAAAEGGAMGGQVRNRSGWSSSACCCSHLFQRFAIDKTAEAAGNADLQG
jgi:hypothetical protein